MKFTTGTAIEQINELDHDAISNSNTSKSYKILCHYLTLMIHDKPTDIGGYLTMIYEIDSLVPTEYEKLCVEKMGHRVSLQDMIEGLYEYFLCLKDVFLPLLIDDSLDGDDMINALWKLYYEDCC